MDDEIKGISKETDVIEMPKDTEDDELSNIDNTGDTELSDITEKKFSEVEDSEGSEEDEFETLISNTAQKSRGKVMLVICVTILILAVAGGFYYYKTINSPKSVAMKFINAYTAGDFKTADVYEAFSMQDIIDYQIEIGNYKDEAAAFEYISESSGTDIKNMEDLYKWQKESYISDVSDKYGQDFSFKIKFIEQLEMDKEYLDTIISEIKEDDADGKILKVEDIKDGVIIKINTSFTGKDDSEEADATIELINIDGKWKVYSFQ